MKTQKRKGISERRRQENRRKFLDLTYFVRGGKERRSGCDRRNEILSNIRILNDRDIQVQLQYSSQTGRISD